MIKIPDSVPWAVEDTAEYCFEIGKGWFTKVKLNESGFTRVFFVCLLNKKSCKIAVLTTDPQAPGADCEVELSKMTDPYDQISIGTFSISTFNSVALLRYKEPQVISAPWFYT